MHPPKKLCWIALIVMAPQFTGCTTVRRYGYGGNLTEPQAARLNGDCRVLNKIGDTLVLEKASISDGQLRGHLVARDQIEAFDLERKWGSMDIMIPLSEVWGIECREVDKLRTGLLVVGITAVGLGILVTIAVGQAVEATFEQLGRRY